MLTAPSRDPNVPVFGVAFIRSCFNYELFLGIIFYRTIEMEVAHKHGACFFDKLQRLHPLDS
jgi:hypothetical protein